MDARRIAAVDQLMEAMIELNKTRVTVQYMQVINWEEASKATQTDARTRDLFKSMGDIDVGSLNVTTAQRARPFVTTLVWAAYQAYLMTCITAVLKHKSLVYGTGKFIKKDDGKLRNMITALLPHYTKFLEEHGEEGAYFLVEDLESKVLSEVQAMLRGEEGDAEHMQRAADVIKMASDLKNAQEKEVATKV
jgi:hypothetical protein